MATATTAQRSTLERFRALLGPSAVFTEASDMEPYLVDWRGRTRGEALAVLRPAATEEVAQVVALVEAHDEMRAGNHALFGQRAPSSDHLNATHRYACARQAVRQRRSFRVIADQ